MRYMVMQLRFDRESFDAAKTLLRVHSSIVDSKNEPPGGRMKREALKRVYDQIRDVEYDKAYPASLDYE